MKKKGWGKYQNRDVRDTFYYTSATSSRIPDGYEAVKNCDNLPCFLK